MSTVRFNLEYLEQKKSKTEYILFEMNCVCGRSDISEIIYLSILISNIKLHPKIALQYINCYCAGGELDPSHIFVQRLIALFLIPFQLNLAP